MLLDKDKKPGLRRKSGLLITHLGYILNFVNADTAHVLMDEVELHVQVTLMRSLKI